MCRYSLELAASVAIVIMCTAAYAAGPTATPPYVLSTFATAPTGLSAPDSIAVLGSHVFVGYGDGHKADGSDGLKSQVVEYNMSGDIEHIYQVPGHNDGLKVDPTTNTLWALQNEDANPNLVIIDESNGDQRTFKFASPTPHGGGYDDIVFRGCKVFISASNPANNPSTGPAIVSAHIIQGIVTVANVLAGNANAIDIQTDASVRLNLQDPDSMTLDLQGDIVLDSQADQQLIVVSDPGGPNQQAYRLPLSYSDEQRAAADRSRRHRVRNLDAGLHPVRRQRPQRLHAEQEGLRAQRRLHRRRWRPLRRDARHDDRPYHADRDRPLQPGRAGVRRHTSTNGGKAGKDQNQNQCRGDD
jgi:hypothetical protein